jgi:lipoprotein-releasing system permease protein
MYKLILSLRYLYKRRISFLALGAVILCVFIVVVVMTVLNGLVTDFRAKNHRFAGDCVVGTESLVGFAYYEEFVDVLDAQDFVKAVSPVVKSYGLVGTRGSQQPLGVEIYGIEPAKDAAATGFGDSLQHHRSDPARAFEVDSNDSLPGCVVGIDLWLQRDSRGKYIYESSPSGMPLIVTCFPLTAGGALAQAGTDLVNTKTFYHSDTSRSGLAKVDGNAIYLPLDQTQNLCGMGGPTKRISSLHIKFAESVGLQEGCDKVRTLWQGFVAGKKGERYANLLQGVRVQSWKENRREFVAAMEKEQTMMTAMFALVGLTTIFIVFVVFYMIISHKSKDLGILKSVGVSKASLMGLFMLFAFWIGAIGAALGVLGGALFLTYINGIEDWLFVQFGYQLWDRTIYVIDEIPNQMAFETISIIIASAILVCVVGSLLPSWQAARRQPAETLQVNQL